MTQFYPFRIWCAYAFVQGALSGGVRWTQIREFQFKDLHHQNSDDLSTALLILLVAMLPNPTPSTPPMAQALSNDADPSVGPFVLPNHKTCMEAARWAWQGALGIHLLPKCPWSMSDWATWVTGIKNPLLVYEGLLKLCLVGFYGSRNINLRNRTRHFQLEQCSIAKSHSHYMSVVLRLWLTGVISNQGLVPYQKDKPESQCRRALCYVLYRCFYTEQW